MRNFNPRPVRVLIAAISLTLITGGVAVGNAIGNARQTAVAQAAQAEFDALMRDGILAQTQAAKGPEVPAVDLADTGLETDGNPDAEDLDEYLDEYIADEPELEPQPWNVNRGPNWTDRILLTYDDCLANVQRFIEVLDHATANDIGLLIFPTGHCAAMYERQGYNLSELVRERGHWIGNHTISHPDLQRLSDAAVIREITGEVESNLLRPPFGSFNARITDLAASVGQRIVFWTLDTNDWRGGGRSEDRIVEEILDRAQPGDNVLMHLQHNGFSVSALTRIQAGLAAQGLELCRPAPPEQRPTSTQVPDNIC